jgi:hypothetical protein
MLKHVAFMAAFRVVVDLTYAIGSFTMPYILLTAVDVGRIGTDNTLIYRVFCCLQAEGGDPYSQSAEKYCETEFERIANVIRNGLKLIG